MVLISTGKFFKDDKITWTRGASAIGSLKIFLTYLLIQIFSLLIYTKLHKKSFRYLLIIYTKEKHHRKPRETSFDSARVLLIFTCNLHSFSANQKRVIFHFLSFVVSFPAFLKQFKLQ